MRSPLQSVLAALVISLVGAPAAEAVPDNDCATFMPQNCDPSSEFDWAIPHYEAFQRHGIGYLTERESIPLIDRADGLCTGRYTAAEIRDEFTLTTVETGKVVEAMADVCPEVLG